MNATVETRIGKLSFTHDFANGYPTKETVEKLFDEMDSQRAAQAYLWGLPIVGFAEWQHAHESAFGASMSSPELCWWRSLPAQRPSP